VDGVAVDWDAGAGTVTLDSPEFSGAPRKLRRALRRAGEADLRVGPRTRIVTEDADGAHERITADDLWTELDATVDDVEVEARGRLVASSLAGPDGVPAVVATKVLVTLPAAGDDSGDEGDDPGAFPDDPLAGDDGGDPDDAPPGS
jgi:hypothetical protein